MNAAAHQQARPQAGARYGRKYALLVLAAEQRVHLSKHADQHILGATEKHLSPAAGAARQGRGRLARSAQQPTSLVSKFWARNIRLVIAPLTCTSATSSSSSTCGRGCGRWEVPVSHLSGSVSRNTQLPGTQRCHCSYCNLSGSPHPNQQAALAVAAEMNMGRPASTQAHLRGSLYKVTMPCYSPEIRHWHARRLLPWPWKPIAARASPAGLYYSRKIESRPMQACAPPKYDALMHSYVVLRQRTCGDENLCGHMLRHLFLPAGAQSALPGGLPVAPEEPPVQGLQPPI